MNRLRGKQYSSLKTIAPFADDGKSGFSCYLFYQVVLSNVIQIKWSLLYSRLNRNRIDVGDHPAIGREKLLENKKTNVFAEKSFTDVENPNSKSCRQKAHV